MRIGMISRTIPPYDRGGIQTHVYNLAKSLAKQGVEVHLFIIGKKQKMDNLVIHPVKAFGFPRLTAGLYMTFALNAARHARRHKLDLIHGHAFYSFGYALTKKLPFVMTLHGTQLLHMSYLSSNQSTKTTPNHIMTDFIAMMMESYCIKKADLMIVTCKKNKQEVMDELKLDEERFRIVYQGVDVERFTPSRCEGKKVLFLGRLHERKGIDRILKAWQKVHKEDKDAKLLVAGKGEFEEQYKKMARDLGLEGSVEFLGHVPEEELPGLYASSSIFVNPSYYEAFGLTTLEAMASGLPVLATDTGVASEAIEKGKNGYLIDDEDMGDRILEVLSSDKMKAMGRRSRQIVEEKFTWDQTALGTIEVYKELLE
jgi:glycosyltransferase involved in cell wall biosynthesis